MIMIKHKIVCVFSHELSPLYVGDTRSFSYQRVSFFFFRILLSFIVTFFREFSGTRSFCFFVFLFFCDSEVFGVFSETSHHHARYCRQRHRYS